MGSLTLLNLWCNNIGDEGAKALGETLTFNGSLTSLDLDNNAIGAEGAKAVANALRVNGSLTYLNLSSNRLCGVWTEENDEDEEAEMGTYTADGIKAIANALQGNGSLTSINIGNNKIGAEGARLIGSALRKNEASKLKELLIDRNQIGPDGAEAIAALCTLSGSLTLLDISENAIANDGATAVANALGDNASLYRPFPHSEMVYVNFNNISEEGQDVLRAAASEFRLKVI